MSDSAPKPFHLSLANLLLWMAATAVAVALMHRPAAPQALAPVALLNVAFAPVYGLAMLTLVSALNECSLTPPPRLTEPGHWLLATIGAGFLGGVGLARVGSALEASPHPPHAIAIFLGAAAVTAACVALVLLPILVFAAMHELRRMRIWQVVFPLLALAGLSVTSGCCLGFWPVGRMLFALTPTSLLGATLLAILIAAIGDVWRREYRDLQHWLGVAGALAVAIHVVLLVSLLLMQYRAV
jgi:hypothetical protein